MLSNRIFDDLKRDIKYFGMGRTIIRSVYKFIRKFIFFEILYIILNDRDNLKKPKLKVEENLSFKIATKEDLTKLMSKKEYDINEEKIELHNKGAICLLICSDGEVAGYTHADVSGKPALKPYLKLEIPDNMLYNFAGLTAPKYRGRGHHGIRHYELMQLPQCLNKKYMMGYVEFHNFAALRGDKKSGYKKIGFITIIGIGNKKFKRLSKSLKKYNIRFCN